MFPNAPVGAASPRSGSRARLADGILARNRRRVERQAAAEARRVTGSNF
jgi:hypothetical protein